VAASAARSGDERGRPAYGLSPFGNVLSRPTPALCEERTPKTENRGKSTLSPGWTGVGAGV